MRLKGIIALSVITILGTGSFDMATGQSPEDRENSTSGSFSSKPGKCRTSVKRLHIQKDLDLIREVYVIFIRLSDQYARYAQLETQIQFANDEIMELYSMLSMIKTMRPEIELEILELQEVLKKFLLANHVIDWIERRFLMDLLAGSLMQVAMVLRQKNPRFHAN